MEPARTAVTFVNAAIGGSANTLRVLGSRIDALGAPPEKGDRIVDLAGDRLLPGLINAHDHLQLNSLHLNSLHLPEQGRRYSNVSEWIHDINVLRSTDAAFEARIAVPRDERLFVGGVKNLLSGVTTVAHHDPLYPSLTLPGFPTRVVARFGWSHSLAIDGNHGVSESFRKTPSDQPWIIHAAEGVDAPAAFEFDRLDALGCVAPNTLLVHGVALSNAQQARLLIRGAGLIWCPSSNLRLFGVTPPVHDLIAAGRVALGTDSRLSGTRDLLDELRVAQDAAGLSDAALERLVTAGAAALLRLPDRGALEVGANADLLVVPAGKPLTRLKRADVRLVVIDGAVRYGDKDCAESVSDSLGLAAVRVDGREKVLDPAIAAGLCAARIGEPGVEFPSVKWRAA